MKKHVTCPHTSPHNDGPRMTGRERYQRWVVLTKEIAADTSVPPDKRLHAEFLLIGLGLMPQRKRPARAGRPRGVDVGQQVKIRNNSQR